MIGRQSKCQRVELGCGGRSLGIGTVEMSLLDHVHRLDASKEDARAAKGLEPEHGSRDAFDRPVILLDATALFTTDKGRYLGQSCRAAPSCEIHRVRHGLKLPVTTRLQNRHGTRFFCEPRPAARRTGLAGAICVSAASAFPFASAGATASSRSSRSIRCRRGVGDVLARFVPSALLEVVFETEQAKAEKTAARLDPPPAHKAA